MEWRLELKAYRPYSDLVNGAQLSYIFITCKEFLMAASAFVRARIDQHLKDEAAAVLAEFGLTVSDAVRMTLTRVAKDKALPFEIKIPNPETKAAIDESRALAKSNDSQFMSAQDAFDALGQKAPK
jgi:DNA-damage-inducible protein J